MYQGLIALDIDGTTTVPGQLINPEVVSFLKQIIHEKWLIIFITGRSLLGSRFLVEALPFPFFLAVQNGAITLDMSSKKIIAKKYLNQDIFPVMQQICEGEPTDFVIFAGCEHNDASFYRPHFFSDDLLEYVHARSTHYKETWNAIHSFDELGIQEFPSVKCFGLHDSAFKVAAQIEEKLGLHVPLIRDPYNEAYYIAQATHSEVSKGQALRDLAKFLNHENIIIAAGDDLNDRSMLAQADIKIVMATAPIDMLAEADIVAPPATQNGIIAGLQAAILYSRQQR